MQVRVVWVTWNAGIVLRRWNERWINTQPAYLTTQLTDVAHEDGTPGVRCRDGLLDELQYRQVTNRLLDQRLSVLHQDRHAKCAQHLAHRVVVVLDGRQPLRRRH